MDTIALVATPASTPSRPAPSLARGGRLVVQGDADGADGVAASLWRWTA
jgi:hypothetical protein